MKFGLRLLCATLLLGCACSASAPRGTPKARPEERVSLEADGDFVFVLADAMGRVDSLDADRDPIAGISGCTRTYVEAEASTEVGAGSSGGYTLFEFDRAPDWPLQLRWRGEPTDTVTIIVHCTVNDSTCYGTAEAASAGGGRITRVKIERKLGRHSTMCSLRIVKL